MGFTVADGSVTVGGVRMPLDELYRANTERFATVYPDKGLNSAEVMTSGASRKALHLSGRGGRTPAGLHSGLPGTNCDYDTAKAFRRAGAEVEMSVLCNIAGDDILRSIAEMKEHIRRAHIFVLSGGFSPGDEPDGSAKFIVNVLNNKRYYDGDPRAAGPWRPDSGHLQRLPGTGQVGSAALWAPGHGHEGVPRRSSATTSTVTFADRHDACGFDQLAVAQYVPRRRPPLDRRQPR